MILSNTQRRVDSKRTIETDKKTTWKYLSSSSKLSLRKMKNPLQEASCPSSQKSSLESLTVVNGLSPPVALSSFLCWEPSWNLSLSSKPSASLSQNSPSPKKATPHFSLLNSPKKKPNKNSPPFPSEKHFPLKKISNGSPDHFSCSWPATPQQKRTPSTYPPIGITFSFVHQLH